ncbi:hypothetical protein FB645_001957 [Coemansia sp. IMI 203386]|nr:hypothetical protein FB645_001957 [Coemansia sp. IMI 203386]
MFGNIIFVSALFVFFALCGAADDQPVNTISDSQNVVYSRGVLLKNKQLTSCEVVPIADIGAFVAANCVSGDENGTQYSIIWQNTNSEKSEKVSQTDLKRDQIFLHKKYKEPELTYNIAVVAFNKNSSTNSGVMANIEATALTKNNLEFEKLVVNQQVTTWLPDIKMAGDISVDDACSIQSSLAIDNQGRFVCTDSRVNYTESGQQIPFAVATTKASNGNSDQYSYALYSHSLADSPSIHNATVMYSYYSVLYYYLQFAQSVLNVSISATSGGQPVGAQSMPLDDMHAVSEATDRFAVLGGNLFSDALSSDQSGPSTFLLLRPTESHLDDVTSDYQAADVSGNETESAENTSKPKLSTGAVVGIAVPVSLVGIALSIIGFVSVKKYHRKRSAELYWNREVSRLQSSKDLSKTVT